MPSPAPKSISPEKVKLFVSSIRDTGQFRHATTAADFFAAPA
jgi:hypothetical protein